MCVNVSVCECVSVGACACVGVRVCEGKCECECTSMGVCERVPPVERDHHRAMRVQRRLYSWGSGLLRA